MSTVFQRIYLGCLAQASYLIGSEGVAAVIDPRRDIDDYLQLAEQAGLVITHVILTHAHADFVAGHVELAAATGARIHNGQRAESGFERVALHDGDVIEIGQVELTVLETPGHTPDSICLMVRDRSQPDEPPKLLTGDTLFLGDVGRPDLAGGLGFTSADMAGMMYESLRDKIGPLPDEVAVFPGHGAGSACGKNISDAESSTLQQQRLGNHALQPMTADEFVAAMTDGLAQPPAYFPRAAEMNRRGPRLFADIPAPPRLELAELAMQGNAGAQVLDTRSAHAYGAAHLLGSINIGLSGSFESWAGKLLDLDRPVLLVADDDKAAEEARMRLARVGIENVTGYATAPHEALARGDAEPATLAQITVPDLADRLADSGWQVVDVRGPGEFAGGRVPTAVHAPLDQLPSSSDTLEQLDPSAPTAIICGSGYRSSAAAHFLRRAGFDALHNVTGGTNAWRAAGHDLEH